MRKQLAIILAVLILGVIISAEIVYIQASNPSIGVKDGDWIEYHVSTTGTPPDEKRIVWAKMEIFDVEESSFKANVIGEAPNGTQSSYVRTFNFELGQVNGWIIIPANLEPGESFYDSYTDENFTIQGEQQEEIAGAIRTTTYLNTPGRIKRFDKATGVFTETIDQLETFTVNAKAFATNMWSPQIFGVDKNIFYIVLAIIVALVVVTFALLIVFRKRR